MSNLTRSAGTPRDTHLLMADALAARLIGLGGRWSATCGDMARECGLSTPTNYGHLLRQHPSLLYRAGVGRRMSAERRKPAGSPVWDLWTVAAPEKESPRG